MDLADFEALVGRLASEVPAEFLDGILEIVVSPRTVVHPNRSDVFTLGECVPVAESGDDLGSIQSRVVLYHGSFAAMARDQLQFDWHREAWETLTHELRHHVEWRAGDPGLEQMDEATEQNFARLAGEPFDPGFYRAGEPMPGGIFRLEDDYFIEVAPGTNGAVRFPWAGCRYQVELPSDLTMPAFLSVQGLQEPPPGEVVLVVRPEPRWWHALRTPVVDQREVWAVVEGSGRAR